MANEGVKEGLIIILPPEADVVGSGGHTVVTASSSSSKTGEKTALTEIPKVQAGSLVETLTTKFEADGIESLYDANTLARNVREPYPELLDVLFDALEQEDETSEKLEQLENNMAHACQSNSNVGDLADNDGRLLVEIMTNGASSSVSGASGRPKASPLPQRTWQSLNQSHSAVGRPPGCHNSRPKSIGKVLPGEVVKNKQYWEQQRKLPPRSQRLQKGSTTCHSTCSPVKSTNNSSTRTAVLSLELDDDPGTTSEEDFFDDEEDHAEKALKRKSQQEDEGPLRKQSRSDSEEYDDFWESDEENSETEENLQTCKFSQIEDLYGEAQLRRRHGLRHLPCVRLVDVIWPPWTGGGCRRRLSRNKLNVTAVLSMRDAAHSASVVATSQLLWSKSPAKTPSGPVDDAYQRRSPNKLGLQQSPRITSVVVMLPRLKMSPFPAEESQGNSAVKSVTNCISSGSFAKKNLTLILDQLPLSEKSDSLGAADSSSAESLEIVVQILNEAVDTLLVGMA